MKGLKVSYGVHRWLGLIVSVQLLAWSVGGLVFSLLEIDAVRGERDSVGPVLVGLESGTAVTGFDGAMGVIASGVGAERGGVASVLLVDRGLGAQYEARDAEGRLIALVGAETGDARGLLTEEEAARLALADFGPEARVVEVFLFERDAPGEIRGRALPVYRVELDHASGMRVYVDAMTGEVVSRRNRIWRVFDFFWMLHIMDYGEREDFNHPLLTGFALLAVGTSASGLGLWGWRGVRWARRRKGVAKSRGERDLRSEI